MSVAGHAPPPFFRRGPAPLARLFAFSLLSIALIVGDVRFQTLSALRFMVAVVTSPMQHVVYMPVAAGSQLGDYLTRQSTLERENAELHKAKLEAANLLLRQRHLEDENIRLRALLDMRERVAAPGQVGEILYAARDPFSRRVVLDRGKQHEIQPGQVVVDDLGVVGQVVRAYPLTSEIALLTDNNQAIPVMVERNGLRAVAMGAGSGRMELKYLAVNAEIEVGDRLVTSGLDGVFLPGLPVARVTAIDRDTAYAFARIWCEPLAGVERNGLVLVLAPRPPQPERPAELDASADKSAAGGKVVRKSRRNP